MKKIFSIMLLMMVFTLSSCLGLMVTPFGYVAYKTSGSEFVYYSSSVYGTHVWVFEDESLFPNAEEYEQPADFRLACDRNAFMTISYKQILGASDINNVRFQLVELKNWYCVDIIINKDSDSYSPNKNIYLNDEMLEKKLKEDSITDSQYSVFYHFEDFGIKRSNYDGTDHQEIVNYIEYR